MNEHEMPSVAVHALPTAGECFHCRLPVTPGTGFAHENGAATLVFCCRGCLGAWLLIHRAGLDLFYLNRDWTQPGVPAETFTTTFDEASLLPHVLEKGRLRSIDLVIGNIRCAACVWLIERMTARMAGVVDVTVNSATGRAGILFDPAVTRASDICGGIAAVGYVPRPYTPTAAEEAYRREKNDLLRRFGIGFFLSMQLMAYSFALYSGYLQDLRVEVKTVLQLFCLLVATPVIFYSGGRFLQGAWRSILNRNPDMDLLVAIGTLSSWLYSLHATLTGGEVYYETAAMIVTLILAGRLLEHSARRRAARGVERLLELTEGRAERITASGSEQVEISELRPGDTVRVGPGGRFPVDGIITSGTTEVDESPATGESLPVLRGEGARVISGAINLTGTVLLRCEARAADSFIARIARAVEEAQNRKAPIQRLADRISAWFVPAVLVLAGATFVLHLVFLRGFPEALMTSLAVVLIACPCALGLATPTAILAGTGTAAASGIIFKGGDILERMSGITVAVLDKTGTLTCGTPVVVAVLPRQGVSPDTLLAFAAAVEAGSRHPMGRAILARAAAAAVRPAPAEEVTVVPGGGVRGRVQGRLVVVGSHRHLVEQGVRELPGGQARKDGTTAVHLAVDGRFAGSFLLREMVRNDVAALAQEFSRRKIHTVLLSGDSPAATRAVALATGIMEAHGHVSPLEKADFVRRLRESGERVLMVGDGINDGPALAAADVGCAMAGGTDLALETSDLVLARPEPGRILEAHRVALRTMRIVKQNLGWAFIYNLVGIPLAMTGRLTPLYAAGAMAASSLCVVLNSLRLSRTGSRGSGTRCREEGEALAEPRALPSGKGALP